MVRMPRAGLAEESLELLRAAVADEETVARFRAKIRQVPGVACATWTGALSGRGHGRFWLAGRGGGGGVVIAHRFAYALEHGVDALVAVPVLGHRCDNPLCQRIDTGHVEPSTPWRNRQEWLMRRHTVGGPLRDVRGARAARRSSHRLHRRGRGRGAGRRLARRRGSAAAMGRPDGYAVTSARRPGPTTWAGPS